jgi:hypothetical protein
MTTPFGTPVLSDGSPEKLYPVIVRARGGVRNTRRPMAATAWSNSSDNMLSVVDEEAEWKIAWNAPLSCCAVQNSPWYARLH